MLTKHVAAGDRIDNPYKIDQNEMCPLNVEIDADRFVIDSLLPNSMAIIRTTANFPAETKMRLATTMSTLFLAS